MGTSGFNCNCRKVVEEIDKEIKEIIFDEPRNNNQDNLSRNNLKFSKFQNPLSQKRGPILIQENINNTHNTFNTSNTQGQSGSGILHSNKRAIDEDKKYTNKPPDDYQFNN